MRASLKKLVSCTLALTLLVTCTVSGLVLPAVAEAASETNLFTYGDFENGTGWESSDLIASGFGCDGTWGYRHTRSGSTDAWAGSGLVRYKTALNNKLDAGAVYRLSFSYKTTDAAIAQLYLDRKLGTLTDSTAKALKGGIDLPATSGDWTTKVYEFITDTTVDSNSGWEFSVRARGGDGTVSFDNFTLAKVANDATAISLNKTTASLAVGASLTLTASAVPTGATLPTITWSSSTPSVATVDSTGKVAAVAPGSTTITATAEGLAPVDCTVTVVTVATGLALSPSTLKLGTAAGNKGDFTVSEQLTVVTTPENSRYDTTGATWVSSNPAAASVDENGLVTAHAAGSATITYTAGSLTASCVVTVADDGERLPSGSFESTYFDTAKLWKNLRGAATVVDDPADETNRVLKLTDDEVNNNVLWMTDLPVRAGKTYRLTFRVKGDGTTSSQTLKLYFQSPHVTTNTGWKTVSGLTADWKEVSYLFSVGASEDTLSRNYIFGFDTAVGSKSLYLDDISLTELPEATGISIVPDGDIELRPSGTTALSVKTEPAAASVGALTWTSSDPTVISVSQDGVVTALATSGSVTITVTSEAGFSDTAKVTVNEYANLLVNGDFELGNRYFKSSTCTLDECIVSGVGKDGGYGMIVRNDSDKARGETFYTEALPLEPSTTYVFSFDYRSTEANVIRFWSGTIGYGNIYTDNTNGEWKTATKIFTTPANMKLNPRYDLGIVSDAAGGDGFVLDNLSLKLYSTGVEVTSIKLNYDSLTLMPGRTGALSIMATPTDGDTNRSTWNSSDEDVATVEYGVVTAVGKGTATITATTKNGKTATCAVTVSGDAAMIKNGTFDKAGDTHWSYTGGSALAPTSGVQGSKAGSVAADGTVFQTISGLASNATYYLTMRYRSENNSKLGITLDHADGALLTATETAASGWTTKTFTVETGDLSAATAILRFSVASGSGPVLIDNVLLTQKISLIDLTVDEVYWLNTADDSSETQVKPGTKLLFYVTVKNAGEDMVPAGSVIEVDIAVDGKAVQTLTYTLDKNMETNGIQILSGTEAWTATEGDHTVSARVNPRISILESDPDNNNTIQYNLRVYDTFLEVPEIAAQAGYDELVFTDEFNSINTVDVGATGADGYKWYVTRPYAAPTLDPDDYSVENGIMTVKNKNSMYNYGLGTVDIDTHRGFSFNQGFLEFRLRIPGYDSTQDGGPAVWSFPLGKLLEIPGENKQWVEMDWMEYWGTDAYEDGHYTITMHESIRDDSGTVVQLHSTGNERHKQGFADGEWHVMQFLWTENLIVAWTDGEEVFRARYQEGELPDPIQTVVMGDLLDSAFVYMNDQYCPIFLGGSVDNQLELDYIHVWSGNGGGSIEDDDNDDGETTIDVDAEDFWYDYCTDDWGDPITAVNADNYQGILNGAELWERLSDERRAEINALLASLGQPSFDELLAAAQRLNGAGFSDTGEGTRAFSAMTMALLVSGGVLWLTRKKRRG